MLPSGEIPCHGGRAFMTGPGRDSSRIMSVVSLYSSRCRETRWLMNPSRVTFPFLEAPARMDSFRCRAAGICSDRRCTPAMPCRDSSPETDGCMGPFFLAGRIMSLPDVPRLFRGQAGASPMISRMRSASIPPRPIRSFTFFPVMICLLGQ